jgi:plastocyanin
MPPAQRRTARPAPVAAAPVPEAPARAMRPAAARARSRSASAETPHMTTTTNAYGNETTQDEQLDDVRLPPGVEPSFVRVSAGKTINMGNYESLRLEVSITRACRPEDEDATFAEVADSVAEKVLSEEQAWLGSNNTPKQKR